MNTQFKKVNIVKVEAQGFKGFEERIVFLFENGKNCFEGENGVGKTSVGDLISWVLTGRNFNGKLKDLNIVNKNSRMATGIVTFYDENGNLHEIQRKLGASTYVKFDLHNVTQKQLEEYIPVEKFLLIFNPMYFLSMDSDSSRSVVQSLIPRFTKEEIMSRIDEFERNFLSREVFEEGNTNEYLKCRRQELVDIEDKKKYIEGYMGKLNEDIILPAKMIFDEKKITDLESILDEIIKRKPVLSNLKDLLIKKAEFDKMVMEIKGQKFDGDKVKSELLSEKSLLEQKLKSENQREFKATDVSELDKKIAILRNDYSTTNESKKELEEDKNKLDKKKVKFHKGDTCPLCKQNITEDSVKLLNEELQSQVAKEKETITLKQDAKKKTLIELELEGKELLALITNALEKNKKELEAFNKEKSNNILNLQNKIKDIDIKLSDLTKVEADFEKEKLLKINPIIIEIENLKINDFEAKNKEIQKSFDAVIKQERLSIKEQLSLLKKEKDVIVKNNVNRENLIKTSEKNEKECESKKKEIELLTKLEGETNMKIALMKLFNSEKINMLNGAISKHFKNVTLRVQKTIESTGEVKDCFEILYNGNELRTCSTSETIRVGLEFSNLISKLSGFEYPVFIDNGESITSYDEVSFQTIEMKVQKGALLAKTETTALAKTEADESLDTKIEVVEKIA